MEGQSVSSYHTSRFALSNQTSQSNMPYGQYVQRPGGGKVEVLLDAILDVASRLIPHAQFYASQGLDACLDCQRQAATARGMRPAIPLSS
jgi:hypothetical protein